MSWWKEKWPGNVLYSCTICLQRSVFQKWSRSVQLCLFCLKVDFDWRGLTTHVNARNFNHVNEMEARYKVPSLNEKLSEVQLLRLRATFHALPLFYLRTEIFRTYARKNYATLEINPYCFPSFEFIISRLSGWWEVFYIAVTITRAYLHKIKQSHFRKWTENQAKWNSTSRWLANITVKLLYCDWLSLLKRILLKSHSDSRQSSLWRCTYYILGICGQFRYWPSVRSRWMDIDKVLVCILINRDLRRSRSR